MHNYIEVVVDGNAVRLKLNDKQNVIDAAKNLPAGKHTITICKNTESGIGYLEFKGIYCNKLLAPQPKPVRKIECLGNSITCGTGSDQSEIKCGQGRWEDQHNAYMSYEAITARSLNAQYHLTAVSGIGLTHSCCDLTITMPQVFDKVNLRNDSIQWNFDNYIPDVVTICLGQNDGIQDSTTWCGKYVDFIQTIRARYPNAAIICLTSPMADEQLSSALKNYLSGIVDHMQQEGDENVYAFSFSKQYHHGCDSHPDLAEHREIAQVLSDYIKKIMNW
jgi:lysophospholipase L1-like esterase